MTMPGWRGLLRACSGTERRAGERVR
jgi:hypothetical protein